MVYCSGGLLTKNEHFLFGRRAGNREWYADVWDIFGGHAMPGEAPADTLVRELSEELGIVPVSYQLLRMVKVNKNPDTTLMYHIFLVTGWSGGEPANISEEHLEIKWFTRPQLNALKLAAEEYIQLIDELLSK